MNSKAQCVQTRLYYPLNDVLLASVDSSMGNKYDGVNEPHIIVDYTLSDATHSNKIMSYLLLLVQYGYWCQLCDTKLLILADAV